MVCIAPVGYSAPVTASYVNATRLWAQGVEMQMALAKCWFDIASIMNPMMPAVDVHKMARPHKTPSQAKPAAPAVAKPKARRARPAPKAVEAKLAQKPVVVAGKTPKPAAAAKALEAPAAKQRVAAQPAATKAPTKAKAAPKRKPAARAAAAKASQSPRRRKAPSMPEQPFKE